MRLGFYPKLAFDGIRKNKRFYFPYILTCVGMVMMSYIIHYLAAMETLENMQGGRTMIKVLGFGFWVVVLFAAIFLFYTNSFLVRRRHKEFGLYNILGMGKKSLGILLFWENLLISLFSVVCGLAGGILFSKMAELCLMKVIDVNVNYELSICPEAFIDTCAVFIPVFALIFVKSLIEIRRSTAVSLIKSENVGEKPPKANYLFGIAGILILCAAYYITLSIESPLIAFVWFFIAVIMVIIGTYLLFISGSVMLCRILQKNKRYYYKKNHFVSVSSMSYRMKRNGAGLASICILSTMVLVIMMGTGSLYFGKEDSINTRYSRDVAVSVDFLLKSEKLQYTEEKEKNLTEQIKVLLKNYGVETKNEECYLSTSVVGLLNDGQLIVDYDSVNSADMQTVNAVTNIYLIPLGEYNVCMERNEVLSDNEVLIYCVRRNYDESVITFVDGTVWKIKGHIENVMGSGEAAAMITPSVFIVVPDINMAIDSLNSNIGDMPEDDLCRLEYHFAFDTDISAEEQRELSKAIRTRVRELNYSGDGGFYSSTVEGKEEERSEFNAAFGGIFFLGIFLSAVFVAATVLIIYYKQMTEGYEDEARFEIMRKVGMTPKDIRKSVNSQMLTVFFLPLIIATLHTGVALPIVLKLLTMFALRNTTLTVAITGIAIVIFGIFYTVVYRITSNAYYSVIIGMKE